MTRIAFRVMAPPVAKARARTVRGAGGIVRSFSRKKSADAEALIRVGARRAMAGAPLWNGPLQVHIEFTMPIPASWSKKKQAEAVAGTLRHTSTPDVDNLMKLVLDGCNRAVWLDDSQVVTVTATKAYAASPSTAVWVMKCDIPT